MKKTVVLLLILAAAGMMSCKDLMDESMINKDLESGKFDSSKWGKSKFSE